MENALQVTGCRLHGNLVTWNLELVTWNLELRT